MMMDGCLTEASNEASMSHDYMVVEPSQLVFMGNSAMGAGQYLNLVKQRAYVEAGETTDVQMTANQNAEETAESEEGTEDEITAARPLQNPDMISMLEELNRVQVALQRQEPQDATRLQHMMLQMLEDIRSGVTEEGVVQSYNTRIGDLFVSCQKWQRARAGFKVACATADAAHTSEAMHEKAQWIF